MSDTDLVERLREPREHLHVTAPILLEAAAEIERLQTERDSIELELCQMAERAEKAEAERDLANEKLEAASAESDRRAALFAKLVGELARAKTERDEWKARAEKAEARVKNWNYEGLEKIEAERDDLFKANQLLHGFLTNADDRAEAAEAEIERLRAVIGDLERDAEGMVPREFNEANIRVAREYKARAEAAEAERDALVKVPAKERLQSVITALEAELKHAEGRAEAAEARLKEFP